MFTAIKNHLRERIQAIVSRRDYTIIPFLTAAKLKADSGMLELLRATREGQIEDKEFAGFALLHGQNSFSQWQQECFALWATHCKRGGVFVEFGAADWVTNSNTHMLESDYGWTGVLIEPLPWAFEELSRRRPRAVRLQAAVDPQYSSHPAPVQIATAGQFSSIVASKSSDKLANKISGRRLIKVNSVNLNEYIGKIIPEKKIDFMSIDVEGPEIDIIGGFDFDHIDVQCLTVEVNDRHTDAARISQLMKAKGYMEPFSRTVTRGDLWFLKSS
jgi:FkbM family methyltransferase